MGTPVCWVRQSDAKEGTTVYASGVVKRLLLGCACLLALVLIAGAPAAWAADDSNASMTQYNDDNYSEGFSSFYPHNCWRSFDMTFYKGSVWEAFCKKDHTGYPDEEISVYLAKNDAAATPASKPTHYHVVEPDQTWANTDRRPNIARFAVFKDKLFLFIGKTYDGDTGMILWEKPLDEQYLDGTRWNPPGTQIWEDRPNDPDNPRIIKGLVVKVMNDKIYILVQQSGSKDLYLITSDDAVTYSTPQKIYTFSGNDCLLNGDVIARGSDGEPLLAFVTKDDANGGDHSVGTIKLWTFDPKATTNAVSAVAATLPGHGTEPAGAYRDATLVAGDVAGCTPYGTTNLQLWGIGWGSGNVYHMQYVFNPDGKSGSFNPVGIVDAGSASSNVEQGDRGYLASCIAPEQVADKTPEGVDVQSLQQYARVWWWGSTDAGDAHGRSLKYKMDYLKNLGSSVTQTDTSEINDAWILQGVIMGLPPYYPNGTNVGWLNAYNLVSYGITAVKDLDSSLTSERTLSISYKSEGIFGIPSASMGLSYSNTVQQTHEQKETTTISVHDDFGPDYKTQDGVPDGGQAWGIFIVPEVTNDRYEVYAPDKVTDFQIALYSTYVSGQDSSLIAKEFDMTDTDNPHLSAASRAYWSGIKEYPNSMVYWDPGWKDGAKTVAETADYKRVFSTMLNSESSGDGVLLNKTDQTVDSQQCTNKIGVSAGAFGFSTEMSGSLTIASSVSTTIGSEVQVHYACPGWSPFTTEPADYDNYLTSMGMDMYLLEPKTQNAFWVPAGAKTNGNQNYPWCLAWHVSTFHNKGMDVALASVVKDVRRGKLRAPLRASLTAKLSAALADFERRDIKAGGKHLDAARKLIRARAGRGIPRALAVLWLLRLRAIK
jgi:hypothetical protein